MVLRRLFGKEEDSAAEDIESKDELDPSMAVASSSPELDPKMAKVINENVEESVEDEKKMADKVKTDDIASAGTEKKKLRPDVRPTAEKKVKPKGKSHGKEKSQQSE